MRPASCELGRGVRMKRSFSKWRKLAGIEVQNCRIKSSYPKSQHVFAVVESVPVIVAGFAKIVCISPRIIGSVVLRSTPSVNPLALKP